MSSSPYYKLSDNLLTTQLSQHPYRIPPNIPEYPKIPLTLGHSGHT
nr:MAG TPA: hypothetical protein [Caudoviricetes sp.]